jgi:hypothetical protein
MMFLFYIMDISGIEPSSQKVAIMVHGIMTMQISVYLVTIITI